MSSSLTSDGYVAFVETLSSIRRETGITQTELASRLRKPQSYVSKTERRERRLDVVEFIAWCAALELDAEEVLGRVKAGIEKVEPVRG